MKEEEGTMVVERMDASAISEPRASRKFPVAVILFCHGLGLLSSHLYQFGSHMTVLSWSLDVSGQ